MGKQRENRCWNIMSQRDLKSPQSPFQSDSEEILSGSVERRTEHRVVLKVEGATLRQPGGSAAKVTLLDLSTNGFCTEWPYLIRKGDCVWLKISGLEAIHATTIWDRNYTIGCKFDAPIHPAVLARTIKLLKGG